MTNTRPCVVNRKPPPRINVLAPPENNIHVYINTLPQRALVDTGAQFTVISQRLYERIKSGRAKPMKHKPCQSELRAANNTTVEVVGTAEVDIRIGGLVIPFEVKIVTNLAENVLIGLDLLQATDARIDLPSRTLNLYDGLAVASMHAIGDFTATAIRTLSVPPLSEAVFPVRAKGLPRRGDFILEGGAFPCQALLVARTLVRPGRQMCCRVLNPTDKPITVKAHAPVGYLSAISAVQRQISVPPPKTDNLPSIAEMRKALEEKGVKFDGTAVSGSDLNRLIKLLYINMDIMATKLSELPDTDVTLIV